ncbi:MAG: amino acid permease [Peptococcaceae bacterium BRH_c4b]|nr:MAG: amino acid permease [Peptococcaceae bacterium BRH_c4b]
MLQTLRRVIIGSPLDSSRIEHERYSVPKGLAILSSDALSSVAYAGEEILHVLLPVIGLMSFNFLTPISAAIIILLFIVSFSFRQIISAYPTSSGGAYIVAKENLGVTAGLVSGAALLFDYLLTVAVSVSAGVAALTSAYHAAIPHRVTIAMMIIVFLVLMNLRGVSESATFFSYPTYSFIIGMFILLVIGLYKTMAGGAQLAPPAIPQGTVANLDTLALVWVVLRAFSSGCTALTGIEAISDAVPNFKKPEGKNAKQVLALLAILLFLMFGGLTALTRYFHVVPSENMTVISQVALKVFGQGIFFYLFQASTGMILLLAANTAFAGFPLLASMMAKDKFLPRYLALRGDRLAFSNGIILLGFLAGFLIYVFDGMTTRLIPLYAVGVFTAFTVAQSGMVKRWINLKGQDWKKKMVINGLGAVVTGMVTVIIAVTKFEHGAWVVILLIPSMVYLFKSINSHYQSIREELDFENYIHRDDVRHIIIVPVASLSNVVANTIDYGKTLTGSIKAVHVSTDPEMTKKLQAKWDKWNPGVELVVLPSPYRSVFDPLVEYIRQEERRKSNDEVITVLIPEFVVKRWWHRFLHNQTGLILQNLLVFSSEIVVTTIPYHLRR